MDAGEDHRGVIHYVLIFMIHMVIQGSDGAPFLLTLLRGGLIEMLFIGMLILAFVSATKGPNQFGKAPRRGTEV